MTDVRANRPDLMIVLDGHDIERLANKNRAHVDLRFRERDPARDRLLALGATRRQAQPNCIDGHCWYLMADPEGNEFCVVGD